MTLALETSDYLAALRRDGAAFRQAVSVAGLDVPVASCPGWAARDLTWHVTEVLYFWGSIVAQRATSWKDVSRIEQVSDDQLLTAFDTNLDRLIEVLASTDPEIEVWSWSDQHDVAFVIRRIAHEMAMHRWDADALSGTPIAIDAVLASDGIDEFLQHFADDVSPDAEPVDGSVHIHCQDTPGEWTIRPPAVGSADGYAVTREHTKADCALRGAASDLLLALWRRIGLESLDIVGDIAVASRFVAATNLR